MKKHSRGRIQQRKMVLIYFRNLVSRIAYLIFDWKYNINYLETRVELRVKYMRNTWNKHLSELSINIMVVQRFHWSSSAIFSKPGRAQKNITKTKSACGMCKINSYTICAMYNNHGYREQEGQPPISQREANLNNKKKKIKEKPTNILRARTEK